MLLGKVVLSSPDSPLRQDVFVDGSLQSQIGRYIRRVGRPRQDWLSQVWKGGLLRLGGAARMEELLRSQADNAEMLWKIAAQRVFKCR